MRNLINANLKSDSNCDLHRAVVAGVGGGRFVGVQPQCVFTQSLAPRGDYPEMEHHAMAASGAHGMREHAS